jgi:NAD(P)H-nitrite reductase large subunit
LFSTSKPWQPFHSHTRQEPLTPSEIYEFNIEVRVQSEVRSIDREKHEIEVRNGETGKVYRERYDALVLAPGAAPVRPPIAGIDLPGIFSLRTIPDSRQIREQIATRKAKRAVVVGGGSLSRELIQAAKTMGLSEPYQDEVAISISRVMAQLLALRVGKRVL